jgi:hypothetical protein
MFTTRKKILVGVLAATFVIALVSCSGHHSQQQAQVQAFPPAATVDPSYSANGYQQQQPVYVNQPAPVVVQQAPSNDGFFTGLLMGHLMSGGGGGYSHETNVTKNVTVNKTVTVAPPAPAAAPAPARPASGYGYAGSTTSRPVSSPSYVSRPSSGYSYSGSRSSFSSSGRR